MDPAALIYDMRYGVPPAKGGASMKRPASTAKVTSRQMKSGDNNVHYQGLPRFKSTQSA